MLGPCLVCTIATLAVAGLGRWEMKRWANILYWTVRDSTALHYTPLNYNAFNCT